MQKSLRDIEGYEGRYKIAEDGTIFSFIHPKPFEMKHIINKKGYIVIGLYHENEAKAKLYSIASLVLQTWGEPKPSPFHKVGFKDGNRDNIHIDNLYWISKEELMQKTINRIKSTMNKRERLPVIIFGRGYVDMGNKLGVSINKNIDTECTTRDGYMIFTPKGLEKYIERYGGKVVY